MAYGFGTTVNPQLGAVDYSNYLRGALAGAQMQAEGGAAIGRGIASGLSSIGSEIGSGMKQYAVNKEKMAERDRLLKEQENLRKGQIESAANTLRGVVNDINASNAVRNQAYLTLSRLDDPYAPTDEKFGIASKVSETVNSLLQLGQREEQAGADFITKVLQENEGTPPENAFKDFTPRQQQLGYAAYIANRTKQAELDKLELEATGGLGQPTSAQRNTDAIIASELASGILTNDPRAIDKRRAELLAAGGRDPDIRFDIVGTYVKRDGQTDPTTAVKNSRTGEIGFISDGKFVLLDPATYQPITMGDSNAFLNETNFKKHADELVAQENAIRNLNRFAERSGALNVGIDRGFDKFAAKVKTAFALPLSKEEEGLTIAQAQQQRLLGLLRTEILGPGVLTEFDAQRIIDALGGDITSIFNNPEIVRQAVYDIAMDKMNKYEQDLDVYNRHVAGRYGQTGFRQRTLIKPNMGTPPAGANITSDVQAKAQAEIERRKAMKSQSGRR